MQSFGYGFMFATDAWLGYDSDGNIRSARTYADFACVERRLVVELDGGQHVAGYEADKRRTAHLKQLGWRVIRFWDGDVLKHPQLVLETILLELNSPSP